jgi:hypothetical protein
MAQPVPIDEDRATHEMVANLYNQYKYDHIIAIREASKIQRELSRAEHEARRIERHLQRIEDFCKKNNVPLGEEA